MSAAAGAGSGAGSGDAAPQTPARATADLESKEIWGERESAMEAELASLTLEQIRQRTTMMTNNVRVLTKDLRNVENQIKQQEARVKENEEKIKLNKQLPYLVANVVELLDLSPEEEEEMAAESSVTSPRMEEDKPKSKSVVIKTTQRQVNFNSRLILWTTAARSDHARWRAVVLWRKEAEALGVQGCWTDGGCWDHQASQRGMGAKPPDLAALRASGAEG
jgi:hypothetical protein